MGVILEMKGAGDGRYSTLLGLFKTCENLTEMGGSNFTVNGCRIQKMLNYFLVL